MNFSEEAHDAIFEAIEYARNNKLEFITPELILMTLTHTPSFFAAFIECGGNNDMLTDNLHDYVDEYVSKCEHEPEFSLSANEMLDSASQSVFNSHTQEVCVRHLVHALWQLDNCYAVYYMEQQGVDEVTLLVVYTKKDAKIFYASFLYVTKHLHQLLQHLFIAGINIPPIELPTVITRIISKASTDHTLAMEK